MTDWNEHLGADAPIKKFGADDDTAPAAATDTAATAAEVPAPQHASAIDSDAAAQAAPLFDAPLASYERYGTPEDTAPAHAPYSESPAPSAMTYAQPASFADDFGPEASSAYSPSDVFMPTPPHAQAPDAADPSTPYQEPQYAPSHDETPPSYAPLEASAHTAPAPSEAPVTASPYMADYTAPEAAFGAAPVFGSAVAKSADAYASNAVLEEQTQSVASRPMETLIDAGNAMEPSAELPRWSGAADTAAEPQLAPAEGRPSKIRPARRSPVLGIFAVLLGVLSIMPVPFIGWLSIVAIACGIFAFVRRESRVVAVLGLLFAAIGFATSPTILGPIYCLVSNECKEAAVAVVNDIKKTRTEADGTPVPKEVLCNEPLTEHTQLGSDHCEINNVLVPCDVFARYQQTQKLDFCPAGSVNAPVAAVAAAVAAPAQAAPTQAAAAPASPAPAKSIWDLCGQMMVAFSENGAGASRVCNLNGVVVPCTHYDYYRNHPQTPFYCGEKK